MSDNTKASAFSPEFNQVLDLLNQELTRFDDSTISINSGLQRIKNYEEPADKKDLENEKIVSSVMDNLYEIKRRFQSLNERLEFSCRHLNNIV